MTLLCAFFVYGAVKWLNEITQNLGSTPAGIYSTLKVPIAVLIGVAVAMGMAQTDFANAQEFFGRTLDTMNGASQAMVGAALGFAAVGLDTTFKTIRNVGANDDA